MSFSEFTVDVRNREGVLEKYAFFPQKLDPKDWEKLIIGMPAKVSQLKNNT